MKVLRFSLIPLLGCSILAGGVPLHAQGRIYSPDEVTQMVAPIALYPDALMSQVLMAATYPTQVTETDRWVRANPGLTGSALDNALATATWDPSVIALAKFPTVLDRMAQNIMWTTDLGDAFLNQRTDVMNAVQDLRSAAYENGTLRTNEQERVEVEGQHIVIQPATPEVIYVPVYQPSVVYGSYWSYPSYYYPGVWDPWPGYSFVSGFAWGFGYHLGSILFGGCDWGHHDVWMDYGVLHGHSMYHNASHYQHGCGGGDCGHQHWDHHSGGVDYHNGGTGAPYGGRSSGRVNGIEREALRADRGDVGRTNDRTVQRGQTGSAARDFSRTTQRDTVGDTTRDRNRTTQRDTAASTTRNTGRPTVNVSTNTPVRGAGRVTMNDSTSSTTRGANRQMASRFTDYTARNASRPPAGNPRNPTARGGNRSAAHGPTGYTGDRPVQRGQNTATARDHNRPTANGSSSYSARGVNRPSVNGSSIFSGRSYDRPSASGPSGYGRSGTSRSSARPSAPSGRASAPGGSGGGGRGGSAPRGGGEDGVTANASSSIGTTTGARTPRPGS